MKAPLTLLRLEKMAIFDQLQLEEAFLRADSSNLCLINSGSSPAIVLGISEKEEELVDLAKVKEDKVPLIRRFSGGGTVYVDEETLFVTFITEGASLAVTPFPRAILEWAKEFYHPLFAPHNFSLNSHDFSFGAKKVGGNAEYIKKGRWLLHTSFLWDYSDEKMNYLHHPKKQPDYRENRPHSDFMGRLKDYYPKKESVIEAIASRLSEFFTVNEKSLSDIAEVTSRPHRKSTHLIE